MSRASRKLQVGATVVTDFSRQITRHTIAERSDDGAAGFSGSGVMFKVSPIIPGSTGDWIDADWFEPFGLSQTTPDTTNKENEK